MGISDLVRKGPIMRVGREVPHTGGGESHMEVEEKSTRLHMNDI